MIIKGISIVGEINKANSILIDNLTSDDFFQGFQHQLFLQQNEGTFFRKTEDNNVEKIIIIGLTRIEYGVLNLNERDLDFREIQSTFSNMMEKWSLLYKGSLGFKTIGVITNLSLAQDEKSDKDIPVDNQEYEFITLTSSVNFKKGDFNYNVQYTKSADNSIDINLDVNNRLSDKDKNDIDSLILELKNTLSLSDGELAKSLGIK